MNPYAKVEFEPTTKFDDILSKKKSLNGYSIVVYGFRNFKDAIEINKIAREESNNIPFYCLNSSGLQGFFYVDIGSNV
jgi:hypothetical protein